jgi:hypothetical protein
MKGGVAVSHGFQFIEHGRHVARHTQHVRPGCSGTTSFLSCCNTVSKVRCRKAIGASVVLSCW